MQKAHFTNGIMQNFQRKTFFLYKFDFMGIARRVWIFNFFIQPRERRKQK